MVNLHRRLDELRKVHDIDSAHLWGVPGRAFPEGLAWQHLVCWGPGLTRKMETAS